MAKTFSEFWPEADMEEIRRERAPRFIRGLREDLGLTLRGFQEAVNERAGVPGPGDVSKGSNWEAEGKRRLQLPEPRMQQTLIQLYVERGTNTARRKDYGFPFASWVEVYRNMFFANDFETLRLLLDREIELGPRPRTGETIHPDNWPYLSALRGNIAALDSDSSEAIEWYEDALSMTICSSVLKNQIRVNLTGALFNDARDSEELAPEDVSSILKRCETICREALREKPKEHDYRRNLLRVLSRLDDEAAFTEEFEDLVPRTDQDELERLFLNDPDHDMSNSRRYRCVRRWLDLRKARRGPPKNRGSASTTLLSVLLLASAAFAMVGLSPSAMAVEPSTTLLGLELVSESFQAENFLRHDKQTAESVGGWEFGAKVLAQASKGWEFGGKTLIR